MALVLALATPEPVLVVRPGELATHAANRARRAHRLGHCLAPFVRKQVTQLASKMRFVAAQFNALLDDGLWIELATHANEMAALLHRRTADIDAVELGSPPRVNSLFPRLPPSAIEPLRDWCFFWDWEPSSRQVRWMTAWDTTEDDVDVFAEGVAKILATCN